MGWRDDGTLVGTKGKAKQASLQASRWPGGHIARRAAGQTYCIFLAWEPPDGCPGPGSPKAGTLKPRGLSLSPHPSHTLSTVVLSCQGSSTLQVALLDVS